MTKKALLIIDMQNDFILKGAKLEVKNIRKSLPTLKKFISEARTRKIPVIYTRHIYNNPSPGDRQLFGNIVDTTLQPNSKGAEIHSTIKPERTDKVIDKSRYDAFLGTSLKSFLKHLNVKEVIITGTMTDVCCACTAHSAMMHNFKVVFVSDLTFTGSTAAHKATLKNISSNFGRVLSSSKILKELS